MVLNLFTNLSWKSRNILLVCVLLFSFAIFYGRRYIYSTSKPQLTAIIPETQNFYPFIQEYLLKQDSSWRDYLLPPNISECSQGVTRIGTVNICNLPKLKVKSCNVVSLWNPTALYFVTDVLKNTECSVALFTSLQDFPITSNNIRFKLIDSDSNHQLDRYFSEAASPVDIFQAEVTPYELTKLIQTLKSKNLEVTQLALTIHFDTDSNFQLSPPGSFSDLLNMGFTIIYSKYEFSEEYLQIHATFYNTNIKDSGNVHQQYGDLYTKFPPEVKEIALWESLTPKVTCPPNDLKFVGGNWDGGKWVCGLEKMPKNCVVYSFGVKGDSSFEAEVLSKTNCKIYAFDPTDKTIGRPVNPNNPRVTFQSVAVVGRKKGDWDKGKTVKDIMTEFGHTFIDHMKMDIEQMEYEVLERILEDFKEFPVGQMNVEFHVWDWKTNFTDRVVPLFNELGSRGMQVFHSERNPIFPELCWEYSFMNINYPR